MSDSKLYNFIMVPESILKITLSGFAIKKLQYRNTKHNGNI